ncbi:amidase family protein, partial [Streptomyces ochraceiscleroticus]
MILRRTLLVAATAVAAAASMAAPAAARSRAGTVKAPKSPHASGKALHLAPAREQLAALRERRITSRALLEQYLQHIAETDDLNVVVTLDADAARAAADEADRHLAETGKPLGPLHGLPLTVKDALETRGLRTTSGSPDLTDHVPGQDADAVARLRAAGALIVGKTNVPTMCQDIQTSNPIFGATKNPHD